MKKNAGIASFIALILFLVAAMVFSGTKIKNQSFVAASSKAILDDPVAQPENPTRDQKQPELSQGAQLAISPRQDRFALEVDAQIEREVRGLEQKKISAEELKEFRKEIRLQAEFIADLHRQQESMEIQ